MQRNWLVSRTNQEFIDYLSRELSLSPVLVQVLVNRGIKDIESIKDFLSPSIDSLHDPYLMQDMDKAVQRIRDAVERKERVLVHGDYDADGITCTVLLVSTLRKLGLETTYHIPNRITEGYGLSDLGIQKASEWKADLIITADCGITSENSVALAHSLGMDVVVTDHHEPPENLPDAVAVVDPHRKGSEYPFKRLAGVGVVFKVIQALVRDLDRKDIDLEEMLDMVALGTVADSVPLLGENRVLVTYGMKIINAATARTGVQALKNVSGANGSRNGSLSYTLIPRINAAGRLDDAGEVVELFLTDDKDEADRIAGLLEEQNRKRQRIEAQVLKEALEMVNIDNLDSAIVLSSPDWHPGVIGIVASRLVERFFRPVFLFSEKDSIAKGSARGIPNFHLYNAIDKCSSILLGYGGHRQAAGLRLKCSDLQTFKQQMNSIVQKALSDEDMVPVLEIDAAVRLSDINFNLVNELSRLGPFGESNREPVFGAKDITVVSQKIVGNNHLKLQVCQKAFNVDSIGFSMGDQLKQIEESSCLDIAFIPCINEWNGSRNLQLNLKAVRPGS